MWNLERPHIEDIEDHLNIAFPHGGDEALNAEERAKILDLYEQYVLSLGRPNDELKGADLSEACRQKLHDAYDLVQDGRRLGRLRAAIKLQAVRCPYCGYGHIADLDHFLQKVVFKPLSIFPLNLVPCCATCNRKKPRLPSQNAIEHQVHVYLEDVSQYDILRADVSLHHESGGLVLRFWLERPENMPHELFLRVAHYFKIFELSERVTKEANLLLGSLEHAMEDAYLAGPDVLRQFLVKSSRAVTKRMGKNDWSAALLKGLSECPQFYNGGHEKALGAKPTHVA